MRETGGTLLCSVSWPASMFLPASLPARELLPSHTGRPRPGPPASSLLAVFQTMLLVPRQRVLFEHLSSLPHRRCDAGGLLLFILLVTLLLILIISLLYRRWSAVDEEDWPAEGAQRSVILGDFASEYGDRRQVRTNILHGSARWGGPSRRDIGPVQGSAGWGAPAKGTQGPCRALQGGQPAGGALALAGLAGGQVMQLRSLKRKCQQRLLERLQQGARGGAALSRPGTGLPTFSAAARCSALLWAPPGCCLPCPAGPVASRNPTPPAPAAAAACRC